jgi:hypothetical protein
MVAKSRGGALNRSALDTGWGLIYRLNTLFNKAEDASLTGDFEKWNFILDRIFVNLCYKGAMDIKFDTESPNEMPNKVLSIKLPKEEEMVFVKFRVLMRQIKIKSRYAIIHKNKIQYETCKEEHYRVLLMKDIWLRKIMMERGLYLKEFEFDPSRAMWGG